jgi:signal transduction histidine kinase
MTHLQTEDAPDEEIDRLRARLVALTSGAEALLAAVETGSVRGAICELAHNVSSADASAIWVLDTAHGEWRVVYSVGLSEQFSKQRISGTVVPFAEPLVADDLDAVPMLEHRRADYHAEGIRALVSVPLPIRGVRCATLVFYFRSTHSTSQTELQVAVALGHLAAATLGHAESFIEERRLRDQAERQSARLSFLADASSLFTSLDYEATLRRVAQLAVPTMSDWCAVDVLQPDGSLERLATAHVDPEKIKLAEQLLSRYPPDLSINEGIGGVLRTGTPLLVSDIPEALITAAARDAEHLTLLRSLSIKSAMIAPLNVGSRTLGAITWVSSTPGRLFGGDDLTLLMDVARRAALAIDNARLYAEAQRAISVKDEFLAVVSHELRTPLNTILGWSTMLLARQHPPEITRKALETIERNARAQGQLVDDLLNFSRLGTGEIQIERSTFDVRPAVAALVAEARPIAERRRLTLTVSMPDTPLLIHADQNRVRQIISNLLSNGVKFTEDGGTVDVVARAAREHVEIAVTDTGIGIRPEFLPHVFERFRQGDPSTTRSHGGLGLGLAIAREFSELQGGTVEAASAGPGQGSSFVVRFPIASETARVSPAGG